MPEPPPALEPAPPARRSADAGLELLAEAGPRLASTLDVETLVEHVTVLLVPRLAAWCAVEVAAEGGAITRARHADPAQLPVIEQLLGAPMLAQARRAPGPRLLGDLADAAPTGDDREALGRAGRYAAIVPLAADDPRAGSILVGGRRPFEVTELRALETLAHLARLACTNAQMFARLQRAVASRDDLLAIVAHDLRNPLETIAGHAAIVADSSADPTPPDLQRRIEAIRRSAATMERLIADVVELDRIDHGRVVLNRVHLDAHAIVRDAVANAEAAALRQGVHVRAAGGDGELAAHWDRDRVVHLVDGLLAEAIAATSRGGAVTVSAEPRDDDRVALVIAATGQAIPTDERRRRAGDGLGLAIAKGIAEAHGGGAIEVSRHAGEGSRFAVVLPRGAAPRPAVDLPGRRVLVIDDDRAIREEIADLLASAGYDVAVATDGEDALVRLRDMAPPSVILLDVMMPRLDALGFCRAKQRHPQLADIPVVVFSAYSNLGSVASEIGAAALLEKPLRAAKLLETVRRVVPAA